jgi:DNA segregation ATPase FtsK/SpoIIIE, S-DNA-T family
MARDISRKSSPQKKESAGSLSRRSNPLSLLMRPAMRNLILIVCLLALIAYFSYKYHADVIAWGNNVLSLFGLGLVILIVALGLLIWLIRRRNFAHVVHRWNWILGSISLVLALWGALSFFAASKGILYRATLGGSFGQSLIGAADVIGILRVVGFVLLGIVLLMPRKVWYALSRLGLFCRRIFKGAKPTLRREPTLPSPVALSQRAASSSPAPTGSSERVFDSGATGEGDNLPVISRVDDLLTKRDSIVTSGGWQLPPIDILDKVAEVEMSKDDIAKRAQMIEDALASYGVEARVVQTNSGPTVTQFGIEPGWDRKYREIKERAKDGSIQVRQEEVSRTRIRVDRITSLSSDLALALASPSIRIEAPVPGKPVVGIEVPNTIFGSVGLRSVIESTAFQKIKAKSNLAIALGKGAGGEAVAADLAKMPHLLIAGATGSGKTVCLDSIICSLLLYNSPDDVQFIMVDPKRVELVIFDSIPHLIAPVVVDADKAIKALRWLTQEMDNRYRQMARAGVRNIESYNKKCAPGENMPFLVLVIDELADLMITAFDEVEHTLCRLAQLARATGIHIIVATQRPSVDVVTGLIKANFPTRMSFAVTSQVDSRTILDMVGAEKLLGRGDMLYMPTEESKPKRLQGTFVSDVDINKLVYFWGSQKRQDMRMVNFDDVAELVSSGNSKVSSAPDSLLEEARHLASEHEHISTSFLQRRLRIGYPRASRLMETLAEEGLTGASHPHEER